MYSIETTVPPTGLIVTPEEMRLWKHLNTNAEDAIVERLIDAARIQFEGDSGGFITLATTFQQSVPCLPYTLAKGNVGVVSAVKYQDEDNVEQSIDEFRVSKEGNVSVVFLPSSQSMPVLEADTPNPWKITFTAGVDADYIPSDIRVAISLLAAHWFVNREATTPLNLRTLPYGWEGIIAKYRLGGVH